MADPAEQAAGADPEARRDDQPEDAAQEVAVVDLADARDEQAEDGGDARVRSDRRRVVVMVPATSMRDLRGVARLGCERARRRSARSRRAGSHARLAPQFRPWCDDGERRDATGCGSARRARSVASVFTFTTSHWPACAPRHLLQLGRHHAARSAPRRPEVHDERHCARAAPRRRTPPRSARQPGVGAQRRLASGSASACRASRRRAGCAVPHDARHNHAAFIEAAMPSTQ